MSIDISTGQKNDVDFQLIKTSNLGRFSKFLEHYILQGYTITMCNIGKKIVPRIGMVVTYFAELRAKCKNISANHRSKT